MLKQKEDGKYDLRLCWIVVPVHKKEEAGKAGREVVEPAVNKTFQVLTLNAKPKFNFNQKNLT